MGNILDGGGIPPFSAFNRDSSASAAMVNDPFTINSSNCGST